MKHKVKITYDPYRIEFKVSVDGKSIKRDKHFSLMQDFIKKHTPLQTWIEPITYEDIEWPGLLNAIARDQEDNGTVTFEFTGRKIDFEDLRSAMQLQNERRKPEARLEMEFIHHPQFEEKTLRSNVEFVVEQLIAHKDAFLDGRVDQQLVDAYNALETNYTLAKDKEFQIVFSGVFSSGKSTIINALIHRRLLPMGENTCTNCTLEIHHCSDAENVYVQCYSDKDGKVPCGEQRKFSSDWDCMDYLEELRRVNKSETIIAMIKISTDLRHLYPVSMDSKDFQIVIVDTPGFESADTEARSGESTINEHERIALAAINDKSKPIVVFCTKDPDAIALQNAMMDIAAETKETNGGFNDRFLFVYSQCDLKQYNADESLPAFVSNYASRLVNFASASGDSSLAEAYQFIPRVFPVAALPSLATWYDAVISGDDLDSEEKETLLDVYEAFAKKIKRRRSNYFLTSNCRIPQSDVEEIEARFDDAVEAGELSEAVRLQSGINAIEIAIRNYVERYAYPIKLRSLLATFDKILPNLKIINEKNQKKLRKKLEEQKNVQISEEEVRAELERKTEEKKRVEQLHTKAQTLIAQLRAIKFDRTPLDAASGEFDVNFQESEIIKLIDRIFAESGGVIPCDNNTEDTIKKKCEEMWKKVCDAYAEALGGTKLCCEELVSQQRNSLQTMLVSLQNIAKEIQADSNIAGIDFTETLAWRTFIEATIDENALHEKMMETVHHTQSTEVRMVRNSEKYAPAESLWKRFKQVFMRKEIPKTYTIHKGSYSIEPLWNEVHSLRRKFAHSISEISEEFEQNLQNMQQKAEKLAEDILSSIAAYIREEEAMDAQITAFGNDLSRFEQEIVRYRSEGDLLQRLIDRMPTTIETE